MCHVGNSAHVSKTENCWQSVKCKTKSCWHTGKCKTKSCWHSVTLQLSVKLKVVGKVVNCVKLKVVGIVLRVKQN